MPTQVGEEDCSMVMEKFLPSARAVFTYKPRKSSQELCLQVVVGFGVVSVIARSADKSLLENDGVCRKDSQLTLVSIGST